MTDKLEYFLSIISRCKVFFKIQRIVFNHEMRQVSQQKNMLTRENGSFTLKPEYQTEKRETTVTDVVIISYGKCMCRIRPIFTELKIPLVLSALDKLFFFPSLLMCYILTSNKCVFRIVKCRDAKGKGC